eukprot:1150935-Pelagomonas_calceolata.AAC.15
MQIASVFFLVCVALPAHLCAVSPTGRLQRPTAGATVVVLALPLLGGRQEQGPGRSSCYALEVGAACSCKIQISVRPPALCLRLELPAAVECSGNMRPLLLVRMQPRSNFAMVAEETTCRIASTGVDALYEDVHGASLYIAHCESSMYMSHPHAWCRMDLPWCTVIAGVIEEQSQINMLWLHKHRRASL